MTRSASRLSRVAAIVLLALAGITCRDRPSSGPGLPFPAAMSVAPAVGSLVGGPVFDLAAARISLRDIPAGALVLDTIATFSADDSTLRLAVAVPLMRPAQDFVLRIAAVDLLGDTLFRAIDTVTLRQNEAAPAPVTVLLQYAGPDTLVAAVSIAPRDTTVTVGVPLTMRALATGADQRLLPAVRFGWRSSDPARISVGADGTLLALAPAEGVWIIARTANDRADSTQVSAVPLAQSLLVTPDTATIAAGGTVLLSAVALDVAGIPVTLPAPLAWSSGDTKIATVSPTGLVTGVSSGTTSIVALSGGLTGTMRITVAPPAIPAARIDIDSVFVALVPGDSLLLNATVRDAQGMVLDRPITWTSLDALLRVDGRGMVTAMSVGAGRVVAASEAVSDTTTITVLDPQVVRAGPPGGRAPR